MITNEALASELASCLTWQHYILQASRIVAQTPCAIGGLPHFSRDLGYKIYRFLSI